MRTTILAVNRPRPKVALGRGEQARGILWARRKGCWALLPLLALLFTFAVGRAWPYHVGPGFPKTSPGQIHPTATEAVFFVYSPDHRTLFLKACLQVGEAGTQPPLQIAVIHGKSVETTSAQTRVTSRQGIIEVAAPLRLTPGNNVVRLALGSSPVNRTPYMVESLHLTQSIWNGGNLLICLTLIAIATGSILAAQALGANGLNLFCAAPLIGFFLLTASATLLSPFHLLTGGTWAALLSGASLAFAALAAWRLRQHPVSEPLPENTLRLWETGVLLALACPTFLTAILSPLTHWDDLMYHGPRAAYWMENASAFPFPSHDDRLAVFPIGGDLLFAAGTILSGSELPGKFLVCLALPFILFALLALLKNAGVRSGVALGTVLIFATTPIVMANAVGIKPDLWLVLFGVITLHWVLTAWRGGSGMSLTTVTCLAAAGVGAACGVKWTAAPLLLLAPFALLPPGWRQRPAQRLLPAAGAFILALALGGAGPILVYNLRTSHHVFGPQAMRQWHQPDPGWPPAFVQIKRLPFILFALPYVPSEPVRQEIKRWETAAADKIGATEPLRQEGDSLWPGRFSPKVRQIDEGFSLSWVFVFLGAAVGLYTFRRREDRGKRSTFLLILGLSLIFGAAVVTQTRWQTAASLPDRFLLPALALGLIAAAGPLDRFLAGRKAAGAALGGLLALHALPYSFSAIVPFQLGAGNGWQAPPILARMSDLSAATLLLPPGRTILLLADQSCLDYPLFLPRLGFANRVLPWGKAPYDPAAFDAAVHRPGVDTVILVSAESINLLWDPPLDARPFVQDMDARAEFTRLPVIGDAVVYLRQAAPQAAPR